MPHFLSPYNRNNPFFASIKERYSISKQGSQKTTQHLVLDLKGSGIHYQPGDSVAVFATHDPDLVERTLKAMRASGDEIVTGKSLENPLPLREFLAKKVNITEISKKLLSEICHRQPNPTKKEKLSALLDEDNKDQLKKYLFGHDLWVILEENEEVRIPPQELLLLLMPLLPRFYSIASSMKAVGEEVHLTIAFLEYLTHYGLRRGVCTHYLCNLAPLHQPVVPIYIQPHHGFTLPENPEAPMIMIGPGTGVAPFLAFMQDRIAINASGPNWLFFGGCHRAYDFFYEDFWRELERKDKLRLDCAFSRDQNHKIYVQHRMSEQGRELFKWLEEGAYLFICGDATYMAKDVEMTLHAIIQKHGNRNESEARDYIKKLRAEKRYLRDVY